MGHNTVKVLGSIAAATAKTQNTKYFATDLAISDGPAPRLYVTISGTAVDIQFTLDGATTWTKLATLTANTLTEFNMRVRPGDAVNFRTTNASGITLDYFRVDLVNGI